MLKKYAEDLKLFRESKKITLLQIANETKIHISNLERIENGDFNFMPQPYIRAFLKQYIRCLGLDEKETLYNFDLAKSGKYQPQAGELREREKEEKKIIEPAAEERPKEEENIIPEPEEKTESEKETMESLFEAKEPESPVKKVKANGRKKFMPPQPVKKIEVEKNSSFTEEPEIKKPPQKKSISFSPSIFKSLGIIALVALMGYGIYLLVTTVFLTGTSKSKYDIVRQNFDTVVKENEKKILGKRSKEEIEDSIKLAQHVQDSIKKAANDSLTLEIKCLKKGYISVIIDSIAYNNMSKESFDKDYSGSWKAKKYFYVTSNNTEAFNLFLNGKKLDIKETKIKYLKIGREGIVKSSSQ